MVVNISEIRENPGNPRLIKDEKFRQLVKSIKDFPQMLEIRPIVVNDDMVVLGGNMRLRACKEAGLKEIPIIKASQLTPEQQREFIIKDNIGFGEWDWEIIANEWDAEQVQDWGLDIPDFAFKQDAEEDNYEIPDEIETDIVTGDLFEIGEHRLMCGDSTNADDDEQLMNLPVSNLLATDPPYNVGYQYGDGVNDSKNDDEYKSFSQSWFTLWSSKSKTQIVSPGCNNLAKWLRWFEPYHIAPWIKTNAMTNGKVSRWWCWEPILFFGDKWKRERSNDVFDFAVGAQKEVGNHPCPKPVKMWADIINAYSNEYDIITDAFLGSGTTMVAAHQLNRKCYGMEIDPKYCQVIIDRMKKLNPSIEIKKNGVLMGTDIKQTTDGIPA